MVDTNPNIRVQKYVRSSFGHSSQWTVSYSVHGILYHG
jgi:hypothetical protein